MLKFPVSLQQPVRFALCALVLVCLAWQLLPGRVQSRSQNLAPDINTGALNTAREGHTATLLQNGKVLVAGGRSGGTIFNTAEIYDPVTGQWSPTTNTLTTARHGHSAVLLRSGLVLLIGGQGTNGFVSSAEIYDPSDNTWKPAQSSQMNLARYHASATLLNNGRVLVAGGVNGGGFLRGAELYDPATRTWTRTDANNNNLGNLTDARAEHTATLLTDGRVLVAGGLNGTAALKSAELYEPNTNRWRRTGDLLTARRLHTATLLPDSTVLVAGGLSGGTALSSAETYNPATGLWTAAGSFTARRSHTATLLPNGRVLALGGKGTDSNSLNNAEIYNYTNRTWSNALLGPPFPANQVFTLNDARSDHTATMLPNAQVLIAGGLGGGNAVLGSTELYEYAVPTFSVTKNAAGATTQMNATRAAHTATLLPNGKVLVAGGQSMTGTTFVALNSAELYDPNTGAWTATGSLVTERYNHTATLLPNGKVLIVGGNTTGQPLDTAELYDPATGFFTSQPTGVARYNHTATLLQNGQVLVVGGIGANGAPVTSAQIYNPSAGANGTWSSTANLTPGRSSHTATLLPNGNVLVFGGLTATNAATNAGALFTPSGASGAWTILNFMDSANSAAPNFRYGHTATLLPTGKVLMSGGRGGVNAANVGLVIGNSEFYNIPTRTFERARAITASRINHTATMLPNGKVLLCGGRTIGASAANCPEPSANPPAQLFDPFVPLGSPTSVAQIADPLQARNVHAATLLATGEVLITGGFGAEVQPACADPLLRHSELFNAGLGFLESWRPSISFLSVTANYYTVNGAHFQGISEASGHGAQSSASNYPVALLQSLDNEQLLIIPLNQNAGWTNNAFSFNPLSGFPAGPALLTIFANGIPSAARVVGGNGGDLSTTAAPTGTISGRVLFHNGEGITANLTLAPTANSPANCSAARTITTAPNGDFVFRDLVISPTPTPTPPVDAPVINCAGNRNAQCISTPSANGCNVAYTAPAVTPAGTPITCSPGSGAFFTPGTTTVNCTATNASGSSSCGFTIVYSFMTCPQNIVRSTSGNSVVVTYPAPTISPSNFTATCTPPSGASFPLGVTTVNCAVNQNPGNTCSFTVTVQSVIGFNGKQPVVAPVPAHAQGWCGTAQLNTVAASPAQTLSAAPEQIQPSVCRYQVTPSAGLNGQAIQFFPRSATFNMTSGGGNTLLGVQPNARLAVPEQTGPTCFNCVNNVFVSQGPFFNLGAVVQKQGGMAVSDVMLEFSVPYEIFDDRLVCKDGGGNDIPCTNGAKTVAGDVCTKTSSNPLITDAEFKCACTAPLNPDGSCGKTVLARFPMASNTGTFTVANVPNGANAVLTPGTIAGGAQYTFSYQPVSPPGLPTEMFVRLDRVAQSFDNLLIIAQTTCTPATAVITPSGATTFCEGGSVMLAANGDVGAAYRWYRDGVLTAFNTKTITVTQGGAYAVEFTDTSGCASTRSASVAVTVNSPPAKPTITPNGPTTFCDGGNVNLTAPAGAASYQWSTGATTQTINVTVAGSFSVRITNASGCQSVASDAVTVTVNPAPAKPTITPNGSTTFCDGGGVNLTAPAGASSYQWSNGATTQTINVSATGSFSVRITNASGCQSVASDPLTVTVNPAPAKPTITPGGPMAFCEGGSVNLTAAAGAASYQWSNGATTQAINVATAGSFTVRVTNASGCQSAASDAVTITVNPPPAKPAITPSGPLAICAGQSVTLAAPAGAASYQWSNGATTQTINVTAAGTYTVQITSASNCQSAVSDPVTVIVNPLLNLSTQPASQAVCVGASATFNVTASGTAPLSYQWRKNGTTISGATQNSFAISVASLSDVGSYDVVINSGCGAATSNAATLTLNAFSLSNNNATFTASGGAGSVDLSATVGQCAWNATSNADWLTITSGAAGSGNGRVNFNVAANSGTASRNGVLTIAGLSFNVTQTGTAPATRIDALSQTAALVGGNGFTLTLTGANFTNTAKVRWSGSERATNFVSATQLTAAITTADLTATGTFSIDVFDAPPGGGASNQVSFTVQNPVPQLAGLNPASRAAGSEQFTLTLNGSGFVSGAVVRWNNNARSTIFVSATQLTAFIPASDVAAQGTTTVTVFNPAPGGGASGPQTFTITAGAAITSIVPNMVIAGGPGFTLTVNGTNLTNGVTVRVNGNARPTTVVNATRVTAEIPASDIAAPGTARITVALPSGSLSNETLLTIANATAHISAASFTPGSLAPDSIIACFGTNMATGTESSNTVPLPTTLAGTRMLVRDSAGMAREAPLFFVSPAQINYLLPTGTASGTATITITASNGAISAGQFEVTSTAPGLFSANANGRGVPAAILVRASGGTQRVEQVVRFDTTANSFVPIPIDLGPVGDQVFLILFGTGIRYRAGLNNVSCVLGGTAVEVGYAGAQGDLVGLDQINLGPLPRSLAGRGNVNLILTVEGRAANTVQVTIQ